MKRVATATVLLAVFLPALFFAPPLPWALLIALIAGLAAYEWARISAFPAWLPVFYGAGMALVAMIVHFMPAHTTAMLILYAMAAVFWTLAVPLWLAGRWRAEGFFVRAAVGALVILPTFAAVVGLREQGPLLLLGVMTLVWIADSAAYFAGRRFGRHKLAPAISPGKSWEGVLGAGAALVLYASAISAVIHGLRIPGALLLAAALLYFSILGDLFESWMKRLAGVKDSGSWLPGHGGVLDRIDALTAALPIAAGILHFAKWA